MDVVVLRLQRELTETKDQLMLARQVLFGVQWLALWSLSAVAFSSSSDSCQS